MKSFEHHQARTLDEAIHLLERYEGKAKLNAGGTDLLGLLKADILPEYPEAVINIKTIRDLDEIHEEGGGLRIGSLTRLVDIVESPLIRRRYPLLVETAMSIGSPQIRNIATLGGNLCQEVRCWYYRYPTHIGGPIPCSRKENGPCLAVTGDHRYHAIMGGKGCFAVCPSDMATALAALNARILICGPGNQREIPVMDFYHPQRNDLKKSEIVKEILIPSLPWPTKQKFIKFTLRRPIDFAIVSVATLLAFDGGRVSNASIALGAVSPTPLRAYEAEKRLIGSSISENILQEVGEIALMGARPLSQNGYKLQLAKTLIKRAIQDCWESV